MCCSFSVHLISSSKTKIIEGQLRTKELAEYIEKLKLPRAVWLAEDAYGIIYKVEYDPRTNQLVGLLLPLDSKTGMPIPFTFLARSKEEIENLMKKPLSSLLYVVMAQPLANNIPPFILLIFGTDNRFTTKDVLQRWSETEKHLER